MAFVKAKREKIWVKTLLTGPSGSGKTYSALRLATGLAKAAGGRIAALDTENGRIRYYADAFDFDDQQLEEPYSPEKYIQAIDEAVDAGYVVLLIDSMSHEWMYCNEVHDKMPGNSFTNWGKITPRHNAFMEKILQSPIHVICTARGKDTYVLEEKNGRQTPKKTGVGSVARQDTEYNYSVTFNLTQDTHVADATKDNTHLFEGRYDVLTEKDGEKLFAWANTGETNAVRSVVTNDVPSEDSLGDAISTIDSKVHDLIGKGINKASIAEVIKTVTGGMANYKNIDNIDVAKSVINELNNL